MSEGVCFKCQTPLVAGETEQTPKRVAYVRRDKWGGKGVGDSSRISFRSLRCPLCNKTRGVRAA